MVHSALHKFESTAGGNDLWTECALKTESVAAPAGSQSVANAANSAVLTDLTVLWLCSLIYPIESLPTISAPSTNSLV